MSIERPPSDFSFNATSPTICLDGAAIALIAEVAVEIILHIDRLPRSNRIDVEGVGDRHGEIVVAVRADRLIKGSERGKTASVDAQVGGQFL